MFASVQCARFFSPPPLPRIAPVLCVPLPCLLAFAGVPWAVLVLRFCGALLVACSGFAAPSLLVQLAPLRERDTSWRFLVLACAHQLKILDYDFFCSFYFILHVAVMEKAYNISEYLETIRLGLFG